MINNKKRFIFLIIITVLFSMGCNYNLNGGNTDNQSVLALDESDEILVTELSKVVVGPGSIPVNYNNNYLMQGKKWPNRVLYYKNVNLNADQSAKLAYAMKAIEFSSDVKFVSRNQTNYTLQIKHEANLAINSGYMRTPDMRINFNTMEVNEVIHALMYALGYHYIWDKKFNHEELTLLKNEYSNPYFLWNQPLIFDAELYLSNYKDLRKVFGTNQAKAENHWIDYGLETGRTASIIFDPVYYSIYLYNSVPQNGEYSFLAHFFTTTDLSPSASIGAGVRGSRAFDPKFYLDNNSDLKSKFGENYILAAWHFVNYGVKEGRQSAADFSLIGYRNRYPVLKSVYGNDYEAIMRHWMQYGRKMGLNPSP